MCSSRSPRAIRRSIPPNSSRATKGETDDREPDEGDGEHDARQHRDPDQEDAKAGEDRPEDEERRALTRSASRTAHARSCERSAGSAPRSSSGITITISTRNKRTSSPIPSISSLHHRSWRNCTCFSQPKDSRRR